ncbi:MAG: hypothetical protein EPN22_17555 [Nitrospirae bacterium]|nr:MAG: hypothetical protein EPN22_17555 [Nitrospirota bacterium]
MKVRGIEWDEAKRSHFRERGRCTAGQVEDVILARCHRTRVKSWPLTDKHAVSYLAWRKSTAR